MQNNLISKFSKDIHLKEILKGSSIAFILKVLGMGLGYVFILIAARNYGAETIGTYSLSITILHIFVTIGVFGFDNSLVKYIAEYKVNNQPSLLVEVYKKAVYFVLPVAILLSIVLFYSSSYFALNVFKNEKLDFFFKIISFSILPFVLFRINTTVFRGLKNITLFSYFNNVAVYLFAIPILILASYISNNDYILIGSYCLALSLVLLQSFFSLKTQTNIFKIVSKNVLKYKSILKVTFPMLLTSSMALVMAWTDIIMLGIFSSEEAVGIYTISVKIASLTSVGLIAINTIAAPKFSELFAKNDMIGLKDVAQASTRLIFYLALPILLVLVIFPKFILGLFGEDFIIGSIALSILIIGQFINAISGSVGYILNMTSLQNINMKFNFISVIINIGLNYKLISLYGFVGAALATAISISFQNISKVIYIYYKFNFLSLYIPKINNENKK